MMSATADLQAPLAATCARRHTFRETHTHAGFDVCLIVGWKSSSGKVTAAWNNQ